MEIVLIIVILLFIFAFGLLFPTILFLSDERKKKKVDSIVKFALVSIGFVLLTAVFSIFYESNAIVVDTDCNFVANFNCLFSNILPKKIEPNLHIYFVFIIQVLSMFTYAFYTSKKIMHYTSKERALLELVIFFFVGIVATIVHYYVLFDSVFVDGLEYIATISANQYGILPLMYLFVMTYLNRDQLKFK